MKIDIKKIGILCCCCGLVSLVACGTKETIDENDVVSLNCKYFFVDGSDADLLDTLVVGANDDNNWMDEFIIGAESGAVFTGEISADILFSGEYDSNKTQEIPNIIMTEVLGIQNPEEGLEVFVDGFGSGVIMDETEDEEGYKSFFVDFNDPKFYSDAEYEIQIVGVEKK